MSRRGRRTAGALAAALACLAAAPAGAEHGPVSAVLTIDPESAHALIERGAPLLPVDLRPEPEYRQGRLPRARSVPLLALAQRHHELPRAGAIVLYHAGPVEDLLAAYHFLRARRGGEIFILEGGYPAWLSHGYGIER